MIFRIYIISGSTLDNKGNLHYFTQIDLYSYYENTKVITEIIDTAVITSPRTVGTFSSLFC